MQNDNIQDGFGPEAQNIVGQDNQNGQDVQDGVVQVNQNDQIGRNIQDGVVQVNQNGHQNVPLNMYMPPRRRHFQMDPNPAMFNMMRNHGNFGRHPVANFDNRPHLGDDNFFNDLFDHRNWVLNRARNRQQQLNNGFHHVAYQPYQPLYWNQNQQLFNGVGFHPLDDGVSYRLAVPHRHRMHFILGGMENEHRLAHIQYVNTMRFQSHFVCDHHQEEFLQLRIQMRGCNVCDRHNFQPF